MTQPNLSTPARIMLGLFLAVLGGLAFVLAFPPYEIWPLALVGFIPVLVAQYRIMPPKLSSLASAANFQRESSQLISHRAKTWLTSITSMPIPMIPKMLTGWISHS